MFHTLQGMKCKQMESNSRKGGKKDSEPAHKEQSVGRTKWLSKWVPSNSSNGGGKYMPVSPHFLHRLGHKAANGHCWDNLSTSPATLPPWPLAEGTPFLLSSWNTPAFSLISAEWWSILSPLPPHVCRFILPINHKPPSVWMNPGQSSIRYSVWVQLAFYVLCSV